jgi:hypothetical protein
MTTSAPKATTIVTIPRRHQHEPGNVRNRRRSSVSGVVASLLIVVGAGLVAWSAGIHLHLWHSGYRAIPTIGPLFLLQSVTGFVIAAVLVAAALVAMGRIVAGLVAIGFLASTVGGLIISATRGLFGFHDGLNAPLATTSLVVECTGIVVIAAAVALLAVRRRRFNRSPL